MAYEALQEALGYHFHKASLLEQALTHTSYANENREGCHGHNERLEFLGDSILGFVVAEYLYRSFPNRPEGELTRMRAELVCERSLAVMAQEINLGPHLRLGKGEERSGGRSRPSILSDACEAIMAAAYLDGGFEAARGIVYRHVLDRVGESTHSGDYKTILQELVQREKNQTLSYQLVEESGPDHDKRFTVAVLRNGEAVGRGTGHAKSWPNRPPRTRPLNICSPGNCNREKSRGLHFAAPCPYCRRQFIKSFHLIGYGFD